MKKLWQNSFTMILILGFILFLIGCKNQAKEEHIHTTIHVLKQEATCIKEGNREHWYCSQCGKIYADRDLTKEINRESTILPKIEHRAVEDAARAATCEEEGLTAGTHCSFCHKVIVPQETISVLGHAYDLTEGIWVWEDFTSAQFVVSCQNNIEHHMKYDAEISTQTIAPTCTETGKTIYTASLQIGEETFEDSKEVILLPTDHRFDLENIQWLWEEDDTATAKITCMNDATHILEYKAYVESQIEAASCEEDGVAVFTASITIQGSTYSTTKEKKLPAIGHQFDLEHIHWVWEQTKEAKAILTCSRNSAHQKEITAKIEVETIPATCISLGKTTYTAAIQIEAVSYYDRKEETLPMSNHDVDYTSYSWKWEEGRATLQFMCKNDSTHKIEYKAIVEEQIQSATCVHKGKHLYQAKVTVMDQLYTDTYSIDLPLDSTNHEYAYSNPEWEWFIQIEGYSVVLHIPCQCEEVGLTLEEIPLSKTLVPATFEEEGSMTYTALIEVNGRLFSDSKVELRPKKKSIHTEEDFIQAIQRSSCDLTLEADLKLHQDAILTGDYAAIHLNGHMLTLFDTSIQFAATRSYIDDGYMSTDAGYAITGTDKANLIIENVNVLGSIYISDAAAILRDSVVTATLYEVIHAQKNASVYVHNTTLYKNFISSSSHKFFYIEAPTLETLESRIFLDEDVVMYTTNQAVLYIEAEGITPILEKNIEIEQLDVKAYLASNVTFKCLSLTENLIYEDEECIIRGRILIMDLKEHTIKVTSHQFIVSSTLAKISSGYIEAFGEEDRIALTAINGAKVILEHLELFGGILVQEAKVSLNDVVLSDI